MYHGIDMLMMDYCTAELRSKQRRCYMSLVRGSMSVN